MLKQKLKRSKLLSKVSDKKITYDYNGLLDSGVFFLYLLLGVFDIIIVFKYDGAFILSLI